MLDFYKLDFYKRPPAKFAEYEDEIENLLYDRAKDNTVKAYKSIDDYLGGHFINNLTKLTEAIIIASPILSNVQTEEINRKYDKFVGNAIQKGADKVGAYQSVNHALLKDQVQKGIVKSSTYFSNKYFNTIVTPKIEKAVMDVLNKGHSARDAYDTFRETIDTHYKSVDHWKTVANASASRSYNYGLAKGASQLGYAIVRFDAILDHRTSDICRSLNGSEWDIYKITDQYERSATGDPADLKQYSEWVSYKEFQDMSDSELLSRGVVLPPCHGLCRSVLSIH